MRKLKALIAWLRKLKTVLVDRIDELLEIIGACRWDFAVIRREMRELRNDLTEEIRAANEISLDIHPDAQNTNFVILLGRHGSKLTVRSRNISQEEFDSLFETLNKKKC